MYKQKFISASLIVFFVTCGGSGSSAGPTSQLGLALSSADSALIRPAGRGTEIELSSARSAVATAARAVQADPLGDAGPASRAATAYAVGQTAQIAGAGYLTADGKDWAVNACRILYRIGMSGDALNSCYVIEPPQTLKH